MNSAHIRQVKDGLQSEATLRVMKQNIEALEEKLKYMDNECQATKVECTTWEAKAEMCKSINNQLESTLRYAFLFNFYNFLKFSAKPILLLKRSAEIP